MVRWSLVGLLLLVCLPGIAIAIPRATRLVRERIADLPGTRKVPPLPVLIVAQSIQALVLTAALTIGGAFAAIRTGLGAPFFESVLSGDAPLAELQSQLLPALALGIGGALLFLMAYYMLFRPQLDSRTLRSMESVRRRAGLWGRVLYGGIVEETMCRFGCMNLLTWGLFAAAGPSAWGLWVGIVLSGLLFGLGHIPSYRQAGCAGTAWFYATEIVLNLWAACIFGWLFATHGLFAAMVAHATFHLVWYPFDRLLAGRGLPEPNEASA